MLSIQIVEYIGENLEWNRAISDKPICDKWRMKVKIFRVNDTEVRSKEMIMEVTTKLTDDSKNEYKISDFRII